MSYEFKGPGKVYFYPSKDGKSLLIEDARVDQWPTPANGDELIVRFTDKTNEQGPVPCILRSKEIPYMYIEVDRMALEGIKAVK